MTFRVQTQYGTVVCRSTRWGDFEIMEYPAEATNVVEWLKATYGWRYAEESPYYLVWDRIVPEDKPSLVPHIIHGIAVVDQGENKLWELIKNYPLSELDLNALYLAATRVGKTMSIRSWLGGIQFPPREELVASLLQTPLYVGVAVARVSSGEVPVTTRVTREVAETILRELPSNYWTAQEWIRLVVNSGFEDLLTDYEKDARVRPFIQEFYARDAARAWEIFRTAESEDARAVALSTLVRTAHPNAVDAVREALNDSSVVVREAAFDNLAVLPRAEYAKWLAHFAYHGIPDDYGETRKRAWCRITDMVPEAEFAEFLCEKLR
jgi:hypothetical protein